MIEITGSPLSRNRALSKEWLDTNGRGGYSSSTILNCHTRKYHGLLVLPLSEPPGRFVILSKVDDELKGGEFNISLSMHSYPMVFTPEEMYGFTAFTLDLHPRFVFSSERSRFEKGIMMTQDSEGVLIRYVYSEGVEPLELTLRPFLAFRDIHELTRENPFLRTATEERPDGFSIAPYEGMPMLFVSSGAKGSFQPEPLWYRSFEYTAERERGFPFHEDLFTPGRMNCRMTPGSAVTFSFSLAEIRDPEQAWFEELERRRRRRSAVRRKIKAANNLEKRLAEAADAFIVKDMGGKRSVIAGYHWFYIWGRDALISLPGLTFARGRLQEGLEILDTMGEYRMNGLIPNCLSERNGGAAYNSVDASLWYFWCLQEYLRAGGDMRTIKRRYWDIMKDILKHFREPVGDSPVVRLESGLLAAGDETTQLTWMDAMVDSRPVTPRSGCPVEINALWYNALCFTREVALETGMDPGFDVSAEVELTAKAFNDLFWIPGGGYLADVWITKDGSRDESVRPNQVFAVSLPYSPLDDIMKARGVVKKVTDDLLTPFGLRTLSPEDERYRGRYMGDQAARDSAYHQGTVWPWLLGHYGEALLKTASNQKAARKQLRTILSVMEGHLEQAGIGFISEIFDGDPPHTPRGCIAQAWSVAEVFRLSRILDSDK